MPSEDAKSVKKEEANGKSLSSVIKKNPWNNSNVPSSAAKKVKKEEEDDDSDKPIKSPPSGSRSKPKKKENAEDDDDDDHKPISRKNSSVKAEKEKEVKKKTKKDEEEKKTAAEKDGKKRERKVYDKPGQKRDPPEERDPLRIFYETLYKQIPRSEMAQIWMMESGLLPLEEAKKVFEKKQKKNPKFSSPVKSASASRVPAKSTTVRKETKPSLVSSNKKKNDLKVSSKKRKMGDDDDDGSDDDFLVNRVPKKQRAK